jgi:hypothetical protein
VGARRTESAAKLPILGLLADVCRVYALHWVVLIPLALVVLIPQGAANLLELEIDLEGESLDFGRGALAVATGAAIVATNLAGEALYAALITALVVSWSHGVERPPLWPTIRDLPLLRLIAADLLIVAGIVLGLVLLIIPGAMFAVYTVSTTVVIELEDASIRRAFERSFQLVRGSFMRVFLIILLVTVASEVFTVAAHAITDHGLLRAAVHLATETLVEPVQGLAIVLITLGLMRLRGEPTPTLEGTAG